MGSALDLWTAFREKAFGSAVRPWIGYMFLLEDCSPSNRPVAVKEPHFKVFPEFRNSSYAKRYELFCRRLVLERHYDAASFMMSNAFEKGDEEILRTRETSSRSYFPKIHQFFSRSRGRVFRSNQRAMKFATPSLQAIDEIPTVHRLVQGDSRDLSFIPDKSVHLIVTSPPYWTLKTYNDSEGQLGHVEDYEIFLSELNRVWCESFRILVPGGRLVCVVGDVCLSRKESTLTPLHSCSIAFRHLRSLSQDRL